MFKPKILLLSICLCIVSVSVATAQDETIVFQERDPAVIREILESLHKQGATLTDYREQQLRAKTSILVSEKFHFMTPNEPDEYIVHRETLYGPDKVKIVSYFDPADEDSAKLLLSLLGGGQIKSITIKRKIK